MGNSDYHNEAICQSRPVHILAHSLKRKHAGPPLPKALAWRRALADFRNLVAPRLASPVTPEARDRVQVETLEGVEMAMLRCVGVKGRGRWSREHRMGPEESKAMFVCFGEWALSACHRLRYIATSRHRDRRQITLLLTQAGAIVAEGAPRRFCFFRPTPHIAFQAQAALCRITKSSSILSQYLA